jgi:hypothetical protein
MVDIWLVGFPMVIVITNSFICDLQIDAVLNLSGDFLYAVLKSVLPNHNYLPMHLSS